MKYGVGRNEVVDEQSALDYEWVEGDISCFWLRATIRDAIESGQPKIYEKGCEHAGLVVSKKKVYMEVPCLASCIYRR